MTENVYDAIAKETGLPRGQVKLAVLKFLYRGLSPDVLVVNSTGDMLPPGHAILEQADNLAGTVSQIVRRPDGTEYERRVSAEEAYPPQESGPVEESPKPIQCMSVGELMDALILERTKTQELQKDRDKWHSIAMKAGAVVTSDGGVMQPLRVLHP